MKTDTIAFFGIVYKLYKYAKKNYKNCDVKIKEKLKKSKYI